MRYRLGIDLGTNSIGWAAVLLDEKGNACGIVNMGVRIFPDGREASQKKDPLGPSLAESRRVPRGQRRRRDRYLKRRSQLLDALTEYGLMPPDAETRAKIAKRDPYSLRKRVLDQPLDPHDLGRALFHLNQRRGFKSNRKAKSKDDNDEKQSREDLDALQRELREGAARTLGELLADLHEKHEPVRARPGLGLYPDRAMYENEFDAIREKQEPLQSLSRDQWDALRDITFFQRPLKPVQSGWCSLEGGERRAAKALPSSQEFRMLQEVSNLRVRAGAEPERPLNDAERERALSRLRSGKDIDLQKPTRDLGLPSGAAFNLSAGGRKKLQGDQATARLAKPFGKQWASLSLDERDDIVEHLLKEEETEPVLVAAVGKWGLSREQAKEVAGVNLPDGHVHLSTKAIRKMLPHLENGRRYDEAVVCAGYPHHSDFRSAEAHDRLPYYGEVLERDVIGADPNAPATDEPKRYGRFPNPTVHIGLNQLRRVVNSLIKGYGKPAEIVVELARDLKANKEQRENYITQQRVNERGNEERRNLLAQVDVKPTSETMLRLRLWEEQGPEHNRRCPYTGNPISFRMALSKETEIDHILPWSKTMDDSVNNKVLCMAEANRYKGDRPPHEAFGQSVDGYDYDAILACAAHLPGNKNWRFQPDAMERFADASGFLERQLNETRYLSRTARTYLAYLYDEKAQGKMFVRVIPGRMTAVLRRGWGLEGMLRESAAEGKQRDDHRHHAIDAFVVANTTQGLLQQFQEAAVFAYAEAEERLTKLAQKNLPWAGFDRSEVKPFVNRMVVSHKPDHGTRSVGKSTGKLHRETAYGLLEEPVDGPVPVVTRMKLSTAEKRADLEAVRDTALRRALLYLWDEVAAAKPELDRVEEERAREENRSPRRRQVSALFAERAGQEGVNVKGRMQRVRRVRVVEHQSVIPIRDKAGKAYKGYLRGGNAFADIWKMPDGRWKTIVVPVFEFNQRDFAVENFRPHPAAKRLMRLHIDDMGALGEGPNRRIVRVRKISNSATGPLIVLDPHNDANVDKRIKESRQRRKDGLDFEDITEYKYSAKQLREQGFRRVGVDEIGSVLDSGPRTA